MLGSGLATGSLSGNLAPTNPGFKPGGLGSLANLSNPIKIGQVDAMGQPGELITGTYHTYHSIGVLAPQISQDLDLSLDALGEVQVSKTKLFRSPTEPSKTVMCFLGKSANNLSLLIDQQELCDNVIGVSVLEELGLKKKGSTNSDVQILDFTLMDFKYLVILLSSNALIVFDCHKLLVRGNERNVRFLSKT